MRCSSAPESGLASHRRAGQGFGAACPAGKMRRRPARDTLIYFGDLRQVIPAAVRHLAPGGFLGFTVEKGDRDPHGLTDSGRFNHHRNHLVAVAAEAGCEVVSQTEEVLRSEYGEPVVGWVTVLTPRRRPRRTA